MSESAQEPERTVRSNLHTDGDGPESMSSPETMEDVAVGSSRGGDAGASIRRQVSNLQPAQVKAGIFGSSSNLVNSIVGAGIIGIPYSIKKSGFVAGILLIILVGVLTDKSLRMIVDLAHFHPRLRNMGVLTFEDMMSIPFGRFGSQFILVNMFILAYGAMVAYLLIVKDTVPTVLGLGESFFDREVVMIITSLLIMVPLSMMRDISQLSFTSFLSVMADVALVIIVLVFSPYKETVQNAGGIGKIIEGNFIDSHIFIGLGVLSTAMACQHSAFLISGSLEDHTSERWAMVTKRSLVAATTLTLLLGVFGYLGYLEDTEGDILLNFDKGSHVINAGRSLLAVTMFFTYPMEAFVARHVLVQLVFNGNIENTSVGPNGEQIPESKFLGYFGRREQVTLALYGMTLVPGIIFSDLGPVLSLTGSLGASCLAYIAPGMVYLGINGADFCSWCGAILANHDIKNSKRPQGGEIELPVAGDATATIESSQGAEQPSLLDPPSHPWWWYPCCMPVWVSIASTGEQGTRAFLTGVGVDEDDLVRQNSKDEKVMGPLSRDYIYSIFFILFGVLAAVAGVISNIYVQVNGTFFSPQ